MMAVTTVGDVDDVTPKSAPPLPSLRRALDMLAVSVARAATAAAADDASALST